MTPQSISAGNQCEPPYLKLIDSTPTGKKGVKYLRFLWSSYKGKPAALIQLPGGFSPVVISVSHYSLIKLVKILIVYINFNILWGQ